MARLGKMCSDHAICAVPGREPWLLFVWPIASRIKTNPRAQFTQVNPKRSKWNKLAIFDSFVSWPRYHSISSTIQNKHKSMWTLRLRISVQPKETHFHDCIIFVVVVIDVIIVVVVANNRIHFKMIALYNTGLVHWKLKFVGFNVSARESVGFQSSSLKYFRVIVLALRVCFGTKTGEIHRSTVTKLSNHRQLFCHSIYHYAMSAMSLERFSLELTHALTGRGHPKVKQTKL